jgi:hypothetical protein
MENVYNEVGATFEQRHLMNQTEANLTAAMRPCQVGVITGGDSRLLINDDAGNKAKTVVTKGTDIAAGAVPKFTTKGQQIASAITDDGSTVEVSSPLLVDGSLSVIDQVIEVESTVLPSRNTVTLWETGFADPDNIVVSYNGTTRKVTVTNKLGGANKISALFQGNYVLAFEVTSYESAAHDAADNEYWLYHNGTSFVWANSFPGMEYILISLAYRDGANFCIRECHGAQLPSASHELNHKNVGATLASGGDLSNYTLNNTTETNRRPQISETIISDDGLNTTNPALTTNSYSWLYLSGANSANMESDKTEIVNLSTNRPYYNQFTGGAWEQTLMGNGAYQKLFVMAIPSTSDTECQKKRYLFIQGQSSSTTLATIQALTFANVNLGHIANVLPEFVPIAEIIIQYNSAGGGTWQLISVSKLLGSQKQQIGIIAGNYLSTVSTTAPISGNGTAGSPIVLNSLGTQNSIAKFDANGHPSNSSIADDGITVETTSDLVIKKNGAKILLGNASTIGNGGEGDPYGVICRRIIPLGQGASQEKTELIIFNANDPTEGISGADRIGLRAPELLLQTFDNSDVEDIDNDNGYVPHIQLDKDGYLNSVHKNGEALVVNGAIKKGATITDQSKTRGLDIVGYLDADCGSTAHAVTITGKNSNISHGCVAINAVKNTSTSLDAGDVILDIENNGTNKVQVQGNGDITTLAGVSAAKLSVGATNSSIPTYAVAQFDSASKGLLIPRVTRTARDDLIDNSATSGIIAYNSTDNQLFVKGGANYLLSVPACPAHGTLVGNFAATTISLNPNFKYARAESIFWYRLGKVGSAVAEEKYVNAVDIGSGIYGLQYTGLGDSFPQVLEWRLVQI